MSEPNMNENGQEGTGQNQNENGMERNDLFKNSNIPLDIQDDPDLIEAMSELEAEKPAEETDDENKKGEQKPESKDPKQPDDKSADKKADKSKEAAEGADKKPAEGDTEQYEFENDVVVGNVTFKKDDLKALPIGVIENIARAKAHVEELAQKIAQAETKNSEILKDPIIAERMKRVQEGRGDEEYRYGMTKEAQDGITKALLAHGFDEKEDADDIKAVLDVFAREFAEDLRLSVAHAVNNHTINTSKEREAEQRIEKGLDLFQALAAIPGNEEWKLNERDIRKIGPTHPEYEKFNKGIGAVKQWLENEKGIKTFGELTRVFTAKELNAAYRIAKGLPVAENTAERDAKLRQSERDLLLGKIGGKKIAAAMKPDKNKAGGKASVESDGAIDDSKLDDIEYLGDIIEHELDEQDIFRTQRMLKGRIAAAQR